MATVREERVLRYSYAVPLPRGVCRWRPPVAFGGEVASFHGAVERIHPRGGAEGVPSANPPYVEDFKHLSGMYEGEVVFAWDAWERIGAGTQAVGDDPLAPARREVVVAPPGGKHVPTGRNAALVAPEPEGEGACKRRLAEPGGGHHDCLLVRALRRPLASARGRLGAPHDVSPFRLPLLRPGAAVILPQLPDGNQDQRPLLGVKGSESRGLGSDGGLRPFGSQESQ